MQPNQPHCQIKPSLLKHYNEFYKKAYDIYCPKLCAKMDVNLITTSINTEYDENVAAANFYYKYQIKVSQATFRYDEVTLLAEVGGYLGLLLGISLLDIINVIQWFMSMFQKRI